MGGWKDTWNFEKIENVTKRVKVGYVGTCQKDYCESENGVPMIRTTNLGDNGIDFSDLKYVTREFHEKNVKSQLHKNDILIARHGENGKACIVETDIEANCLNVVIIEPDETVLLPYFLKYLFDYSEIKYQIQGATVGSVQSVVNTKTIAQLKVPVPSLGEQEIVVKFLKNIDDKIAINTAINRNLSEQAKILFKDRFIDLDAIPSDWQELMLEDIASLSAGGDKPKVVTNEITDSCSVPIYSNGISDEGLYGYTEKAKIFDESVTVSARGTIGYVCLRQEPYVPIVRLVSVVPKENIMSAKYLYLWLESLHIMGTGTTQQQLTVPDFKKTKIIVPPYSVIKEFTEIVNPMYEVILKNKKENKGLEKVRDSLLPKLMSGELDVSDLDI